MPMPPSRADVEDDDRADGQGGPSLDGPPGPDDMGADDAANGEDDETDGPGDTLPPGSVE